VRSRNVRAFTQVESRTLGVAVVAATTMAALMAALACTAGDRPATPESFAHSVTIDSVGYRAMPRLALRHVATICGEERRPAQCPRNPIHVAIAGPNGSVYLAEKGTVLRQFDEHGAYMRIVGNSGTDSGQYQGVDAASYDGGARIHVFDQSTLQLLTYDTASRHLGTMRVLLTHDYVGAKGSPDGLVMLSVPPAKHENDRVAARLDAADAASGKRHRVAVVDARASRIEGKDLQPMRPFFLPRPVWAAGRDHSIIYAAGENEYIARYDTAGQPKLLVKFAVPPVPISEAEVEREKKRIAALFTGEWRASAQPYIDSAAARSPRYHAVFTDLAILDDGSLWIRESPEAEADSVRWDVLDVDGAPLGFAMLPNESRVTGGRLEHLQVVTESALNIFVVQPVLP